MSNKYDEKKRQFNMSVLGKGFLFFFFFWFTVTRTMVKSIPQSPDAASIRHKHVTQLRRSAAADPVDPIGHGTIFM